MKVLFVCLLVYLSIYLSIYLLTYLFIYLFYFIEANHTKWVTWMQVAWMQVDKSACPAIKKSLS